MNHHSIIKNRKSDWINLSSRRIKIQERLATKKENNLMQKPKKILSTSQTRLAN